MLTESIFGSPLQKRHPSSLIAIPQRLTLDVRSDNGLSFSMVHSAVLSLETDGLHCVPVSSYGSSTVVDASETATSM
jgi:hypothetical protein